MSRKAAARFLTQVRANAELRKRLGARPTPEAYLAEGARVGLEFTLDELRGVVGAEQFYQRIIDDPTLSPRLRSAPDEDTVVEMARRMGFQLDVVDLQAVLHPHGSAELTDSEMNGIVGGAFSFPNVTKAPAPPAPFVPIPYPNW